MLFNITGKGNIMGDMVLEQLNVDEAKDEREDIPFMCTLVLCFNAM